MRRYLKNLLKALLGKQEVQVVTSKVPLTKGHIKELKKVFPVKLYKVGTSIETIAYEAGKQEVVNYLDRTLGERLF